MTRVLDKPRRVRVTFELRTERDLESLQYIRSLPACQFVEHLSSQLRDTTSRAGCSPHEPQGAAHVHTKAT